MFKKDHVSWNKGLKMSDEFKQKVSIGHKGQIPWNKQEKIYKSRNCHCKLHKPASPILTGQ